MSYRFGGADPFLRAGIGALNGYALRQSPFSLAALLKRNSAGTNWRGVHAIDTGGATAYGWTLEFQPTNELFTDLSGAGTDDVISTAQFASTTSFEILGYCWDGLTTAGHHIWRTKVGAAAWGSETDTHPATGAATIGSGYRQIIGNEPGLLDDGDYDLVCLGWIKSNLSQASFESLDMVSLDTWKAVFTGASAFLMAFDDISTRTDLTGNGGNETARSAGITLQADPAGWTWGGAPAIKPDYSRHPKYVLRGR
jgi:hypothetical protein